MTDIILIVLVIVITLIAFVIGFISGYIWHLGVIDWERYKKYNKIKNE